MTSNAADICGVAPDPQSPYYFVTPRKAARPWRASTRQSIQIAWCIAYLLGAPGLIAGLSQSWEFALGALGLTSAFVFLLCVLPLPFYYYCNRVVAGSHFPRTVDYVADSEQILVATKDDNWSIHLRDSAWAAGTNLQGEHGELFPVRDAVLLHVGYTYAEDISVPYIIWIEEADVTNQWRKQLVTREIPTFEPPAHRRASLQPPPEVKRAGMGACLGVVLAPIVDFFATQFVFEVPPVSLYLYTYATGGLLGYVSTPSNSVSRVGPVEFAIRMFLPNMLLVLWSRQGDKLEIVGVTILVGMYALSSVLVGLIHAYKHRQAETSQD
jgi:hypothetical protein